MRSDSSTLATALLTLALVLGQALWIATQAPPAFSQYLFAGNGPLLAFSAFSWCLLALMALFSQALRPPTRLAGAAAALLLAAAIHGLHQPWPTMRQLLQAPVQSLQQLPAGWLDLAGVVLLIAALLVLMLQFMRYARIYGLRHGSIRLVLVSLLAASGILLLRDAGSYLQLMPAGLVLPAPLTLLAAAKSAALSAALPLLLLAALIAHGRR